MRHDREDRAALTLPNTARATAGPRRGGIMILSLVVVTVVAIVTAGVLRLSLTASGRQQAEADQLRAFYLAEAGLAEAVRGLRYGLRGQLASAEEPARFGDGVVWVDSMPTEEGLVLLRATGVCGSGLSSLELVVQPVEEPLGIFSVEDFTIDQPVTLTGFDSSSVLPDPEPVFDPSVPMTSIKGNFEGADLRDLEDKVKNREIAADWDNGIVLYEGTYFHFKLKFRGSAANRPDGAVSSWIYDLQANNALNRVTVDGYYASPPYLYGSPISHGGAPGTLGTNGAVDSALIDGFGCADALIGSNGDIQLGGLGDAIVVQGDVIPGSASLVFELDGSSVSGETDPRDANVDLPPVEIPTIARRPGHLHADALPMVVSSGETGYEFLEVATNAELVLRGPATIVVGTLTLNEGASLTMDTTDGDVSLFVTTGLNLAPGSFVTTPSRNPDDVSFQVAELNSQARFEATSQFFGTIYAPESEVHIGADFELFGGAVARRLELAPGAALHFDRGADEDLPTITSWRLIGITSAPNALVADPLRAIGFRGSLRSLREAHDMGGIDLDLEYVDSGRSNRVYEGPERDFDWSLVREVVSLERDGWKNWEEGDEFDLAKILEVSAEISPSGGTSGGTGGTSGGTGGTSGGTGGTSGGTGGTSGGTGGTSGGTGGTKGKDKSSSGSGTPGWLLKWGAKPGNNGTGSKANQQGKGKGKK